MCGGLGFVIAAILFFGWRKSTRQWQRAIAWIAGIWAVISILYYIYIFFLASSITSTIPVENAKPQEAWKTYSNLEAGISFKYPDYLSIQTDTDKQRGESGELIRMTAISATSSNPTVAVVVRIIEDPLRNQMYPDQYPPDEDLFKLLVVGDMGDLSYDDTEINESAIMSASKNARTTKINGHHAATYNLGLDNRDIGHISVRGALVITEKRDISLFVIGSDEPDAPGSVSSKTIDDIWSRFVETLKIDY